MPVAARELTEVAVTTDRPAPHDAQVPVSEADESGESALVAALRRGDEDAFLTLVGRYHASMVRVAQAHVSDRAVAEEVAQDAWLGVLTGLPRFEGRASFRTWLFRILVNRARTRAVRERRSQAVSSLHIASETGPTVDPARFFDDAHSRLAGHWMSPPRDWDALPEERLLREEVLVAVQSAIAALPPRQREVITLRDIDGWPAVDVCNVLSISETNQRVLLHRARATVRQELERVLADE